MIFNRVLCTNNVLYETNTIKKIITSNLMSIPTTPLRYLCTKYKEKTNAIIGTALFEEIQKRIMMENRI